MIMSTFWLLGVLLASAPFLVAGERVLQVPREQASMIADKIYRNECGGKVENLISWNVGEASLSLGIGHFIWYPPSAKGRFEERFPQFIAFCQARGKRVPAWLEARPSCPWESREAFLQEGASPRLLELRQFLLETCDLQTLFMARRLEEVLPKICLASDYPDKIVERFWRVAGAPQGVYVLMDYVNFKGEGISASERYSGQGWGLLQVLDEMETTQDPIQDFINSAKKVLARRIANAPCAKDEKRWLAGWYNRLDTYL